MPKQKPSGVLIFERFLRDSYEEEKDEKKSVPVQAAQPSDLILRAKAIYDEIPQELINCFTEELFKNVVLTKHGYIFERESLEVWLESNSSCPLSRKPLTRLDLQKQSDDDIVVQLDLNEIIKGYTQARENFFKLITADAITEADILSYQEKTAQAVSDFKAHKDALAEANIELALDISYRKCCFPDVVASYDDFCDSVPVLSDNNEWVAKNLAVSYTEHKDISASLWNLNNQLAALTTAIINNPSHQLQNTISKLDAEYKSIQDKMENLRQLQIASSRCLNQCEAKSTFYSESALVSYKGLDLWDLATHRAINLRDPASPVNILVPLSDNNPINVAPVERNIDDAIPV